MNKKLMRSLTIVGAVLVTVFLCGCDTLLGSSGGNMQAFRTMHTRIEDVEDSMKNARRLSEEDSRKSIDAIEMSRRSAENKAKEDELKEGRLEAARLGFGDYVVDPETGKPVFVWKTHLFGNNGIERNSRAEQPELHVPEGE